MGCEIQNGVLRYYEEETGVRELVIPDGVTSIEEEALAGCDSLTAVILPDSVTSIGEEAFSCCTNLTSIVIPDSVTNIGACAFFGCKGLADEKGFVVVQNVLYDYFGSESDIIIPHGVTHIGQSAFAYGEMTAVIIPDSVTSIGEEAFRECIALTAITIPDSVTSIGAWAFNWCEGLTSVTIPDSVTDMADEAFWGCRQLKKLPAFGYVVDGSQCDWYEVGTDDVRWMLESKDYSVNMDAPTKFQFVAQVFLQDNQPEAEAYLKENISEILPYFIDIDDYDTVKALLASGKFVTQHNIMEFIDKAIDHTQKDGDMQIQVLLMNYRNEHFPDIDPLKGLRL